jgi:hypothetical protein
MRFSPFKSPSLLSNSAFALVQTPPSHTVKGRVASPSGGPSAVAGGRAGDPPNSQRMCVLRHSSVGSAGAVALSLSLLLAAAGLTLPTLHAQKNAPPSSALVKAATLATAARDVAVAKPSAADYLATRVVENDQRIYVFHDFGDGLNQYTCMSRMGNGVASMDDTCTTDIATGVSSIKVSMDIRTGFWSGFQFLNGILPLGNAEPEADPGTRIAYQNLTGATTLRFRAKGAVGGEKVRFYVGGFIPLSAPENKDTVTDAQTGIEVTLTTEWREYSIDLRGLDLSRVGNGFAWVSNDERNSSRIGGQINFYLDEIYYELATPQKIPSLLRSYSPVPLSQKESFINSIAYIYDSAVATIALSYAGKHEQARRLADSIVFCVNNDRKFTDGRIRNAYNSGVLKNLPGWDSVRGEGTARLPGVMMADAPGGTKYWHEDFYADSTSTGNVAWCILALNEVASRSTGDMRANYIATAKKMANFVLTLRDDSRQDAGFTGGYDGFDDTQRKTAYASTEHCADLTSAFAQLATLVESTEPALAQTYRDAAEHAKRFIKRMYNSEHGYFYTGTDTTGATNTDVLPLDAQTWTLQALQGDPWLADKSEKIWTSLDTRFKSNDGGYDFNQDALNDGHWTEGTAQAAVNALTLGKTSIYKDLLALLNNDAAADGSIAAASKDGLTTGFWLEGVDEKGNPVGNEWLYSTRPQHVGATAWLSLAQIGCSPLLPFTAPVITQQPLSQTIPQTGGSVTFSVETYGRPALSYQWRKDGVNISGATNATLALPAAKPADVGNYTVVITNSSGSTTSAIATLTVNTNGNDNGDGNTPVAPSVTTSPTSQTVAVGSTATFSVSATGDGALSYQWHKDGVALAGETASTLTIANVSAANAGSYTVVVTNAGGSVTSAAATLTVNTNGGGDNPVVPVITADPDDVAVREGATAVFHAVAAGENLSYEWLFNGTAIEGANSATFTLTRVLLDDAGSYQVRVTNANGSDISEPATLTVTGYDIYGLTTKGAKLTAPKFDKKANPLAPKTKQTFYWTVDFGDGAGAQTLTNKGKPVVAASYTAKADGHYAVYYNYTPAGATAPTAVLAADYGWVQVFPVLKFHKTDFLLIADQVTSVPSIKNGVVIADGEFVGLTAKLETAPETPIIYTWLDGKTVIRESEPTFAETDYFLYAALTAKSKISVTVRTVATDAKGKPLSLVKGKTLAIKPILPPAVTITTKTVLDANGVAVVRVAAGKALSLKTKVTGTSKFTYQWQYRADAAAEWEALTDSPKGTAQNAISGAAKATLSVKGATAAATGEYRVVVTNAAGLSYAAAATAAVAVQ